MSVQLKHTVEPCSRRDRKKAATRAAVADAAVDLVADGVPWNRDERGS
jgi:hypothetical protein